MRHLTLLRPARPMVSVIVIKDKLTGHQSEVDVSGRPQSIIDDLLTCATRAANPALFEVFVDHSYGPRVA